VKPIKRVTRSPLQWQGHHAAVPTVAPIPQAGQGPPLAPSEHLQTLLFFRFKHIINDILLRGSWKSFHM
jgi:hypothetical protein